MNKQNFLSTVRQNINGKSYESLKKLVIEFARLIPRNDFEEALSSLNKSDVIILRSTTVDLQIAVKQLCDSIVNGDYILT